MGELKTGKSLFPRSSASVSSRLSPGQLICRKQSAQQANRDFKILNVDIFVKGKILENVLLRAGGFILESHDDHCVESIYRRHQEWLRVPIVVSLAQRFQIIVAPGIFLVTVPGVKKFCFYFSRKLTSVNWVLCLRSW